MPRLRILGPLGVVGVAVAGYTGLLLWRSAQTEIQLQNPVKVIGAATPVRVLTINRNGIRQLSVWIDQNGKSYAVFTKEYPAVRWNPFRAAQAPAVLDFEVGAKAAPGLRDGRAVVRIEAVSNDLMARSNTTSVDVEVNTKPPGLAVDDVEIVATLGGSGAVAFTTSGYVTESGVRVWKYVFPSWPIPDAPPERRIALFALPHDLPEGEFPRVFAKNPSGAEVEGRIRLNLTRKAFRHREIRLDDGFLKKVLDELDPGGKGSDVIRFVRINKDMRQYNDQQLASFHTKTADRMLWDGPFLQLANSSVEAQYCDYRTYFYKGEQVDQQVHLGFDLATTAHAPVTAANDGQVVFAGKLGIYGNALVIDHGMGLQTLYAHLSELLVQPGNRVKKRQVIGRSGSTGLAGGDHLHFTTLLDGVPVNPIEWWDAHWLKDRVFSRMKNQ